ncbi:MAG: RuBisCO large subunit C-terminal-like domain-containing protein [Candidatus Omnitrophota bacterium]
MYERYYNPEIFVQTFDGIDRDNYVVATYYMDDVLPGEDFIDHFTLIQAMALEGSTGTWEKVAEDTAEMRQVFSSKLVGYFEIPTPEPDRRQAVVQLAFPVDAWGDNVPMMLLAIAGNCFAYSPNLRLLDVFLPKNFLAFFKGPKFGVPGIRKMLGVPKRPLSLHIIKPKMGMTPQQVANQCYQTALGGVDLIKDDEMTSDVSNNNYLDRLKAVREALDKAESKTGKKVIYLLSITHEPKQILERAYKAVEAGANGLLVTYSAGLGSFRQLTEDPKINVPVMMHGSHMIAGMKSIAWPVFAKMCRICGADMMLTPTMWSSIPMVSLEEGIRTSQVKLAPLGHIKPTWPMPCAGVYPGLAPVLIGEYGLDIIIPAGGGMLGHPDGYTAGAKAWQQAIAAVMSPEESFLDFARKPENKELRRAIEKWGYLERPKSPWLRVAPKFHPKKMEF